MDNTKKVVILQRDEANESRELEITLYANYGYPLVAFVEQDNPSERDTTNRDIIMFSRAQLVAFVDLATEALATMGQPETRE